MHTCLPKKKPPSLPNSTALNLKIETKVDLFLDSSLKCPLKGATAPHREQQGAGEREWASPVFPASDAQGNQAAAASLRGQVKGKGRLSALAGPGRKGASLWHLYHSNNWTRPCRLRQWPFLSLSLFICKMPGLDWVIAKIASKK